MLKVLLKDYNCLLLCLVMLLCSVIWIPGFISPLNLLNIVVESSIIGILAIGMMFLLLLGLFDMSIGMQVSLCALVAAYTVDLGVLPCILIVIATGLAVGLVNSLITSKLKINAFITTFAMMGILKGVTLLISDGKSVLITNEAYLSVYSAAPLGVPVCVIIFVVLAVLSQLFLTYTKKGVEIYVCGGNQEAARVSGVNLFATTAVCFMIMSFCAAIVAILMTSRVNSASPILGTNYTLLVITACVIGGIKFNGGYGNVLNTFLGVLAMQLLANMMNMTNTYGFIQSLINGMILLIVLAIDKFTGSFHKRAAVQRFEGGNAFPMKKEVEKI
jgi:ribose transport system permease protein